jgi:hypothetical protein
MSSPEKTAQNTDPGWIKHRSPAKKARKTKIQPKKTQIKITKFFAPLTPFTLSAALNAGAKHSKKFVRLSGARLLPFCPCECYR